ncbi:hypothetical protein F4804DRAFT_337231 [Jackrogersella minutella]|nr:hypothetical protein F4804DRAFT_337231 [Jackrogersella minutella]
MESSTSSAAEDSVQNFLDVPYGQRWELLKPAIIHIYIQENNKLAQLAGHMKDEYSFDAQLVSSAHCRKLLLIKWKIKKRTVAEEKGVIISAFGKRRRDATSTSDAIINQGGFEKTIDKKQLKWYMNQYIRQSENLT